MQIAFEHSYPSPAFAAHSRPQRRLARRIEAGAATEARQHRIKEPYVVDRPKRSRLALIGRPRPSKLLFGFLFIVLEMRQKEPENEDLTSLKARMPRGEFSDLAAEFRHGHCHLVALHLLLDAVLTSLIIPNARLGKLPHLIGVNHGDRHRGNHLDDLIERGIRAASG